MIINRELIASEWAEKVVPVHPVPETLFDHQLDAMSLIHQGQNVFLGTLENSYKYQFLIKMSSGVPTGSGKTLPQLGTVLMMSGISRIIFIRIVRLKLNYKKIEA